MSFSFGFSGDDFEDNGSETHAITAELQKFIVAQDEPLILPKSHNLSDLLHGLPSQLSYNFLRLPGESTAEDVFVARRALFDIRTQLMAEANPDVNDHDNLLDGLDKGDLTSGVYEGGFKTWECALDLASLTAKLNLDNDIHVIEIGAGSAIPSLAILQHKLHQEGHHHFAHFTLCDYNEDVLRLTTAPNIFLAQQVSIPERGLASHQDLEVEDIDDEKITASTKTWADHNVSFDFVSGAWGDDFTDLVLKSAPAQTHNTLILASETIYSPASTRTFAQTLMQLLLQNPNAKAWVAAKKIYFGVGGSIDDFTHEIHKRHGCLRTILDVQGGGVGRVVLEVTANQDKPH